MGVSNPPQFATRKMKKTTMCAVRRRLLLARSSGRIKRTEAPVVPRRFASTAPSPSIAVFTPLVNTAMLGLGAVLANLLGTTGASVLLIRPLLRANKSRRRTAHIVVFFIFLVANCGGLLTPIGDPPLLLGFLKGVPFEWTLRLWPQWLTATGVLLVVFNVWDQWALNREERERPGSQLERVMVHEPVRVNGAASVAALGGVMLTIIAAGGAAAAGRPWGPGRAGG